ncbi:14699_t:CDS:1, partial [Racocetra fulgida]
GMVHSNSQTAQTTRAVAHSPLQAIQQIALCDNITRLVAAG